MQIQQTKMLFQPCVIVFWWLGQCVMRCDDDDDEANYAAIWCQIAPTPPPPPPRTAYIVPYLHVGMYGESSWEEDYKTVPRTPIWVRLNKKIKGKMYCKLNEHYCM